ncbi:MAG: YicC/YloC family endoribonuclease [Pseudomonadota bacterium]
MTTISSMTGFGRTAGIFEDAHWTWELKSVNSRSLDLRFRLPQFLDDLEQQLREKLNKVFHRGAINISLNIERPQRNYDVRINEPLLQQITKFAERAKLPAPSLDGLLALKGVVDIVEEPDSEKFQAGLKQAVLKGLDEGVVALQKARRAEGAIISALFITQIESIDDAVEKADALPSRQPEAIKAKLKEQIQPLLENNSFDEARLYQEAMILATRVDIREELDRLRAHTGQFRALMKEGGAVGRRLDFLAQEFNREANTLCSKSHDKDLTALGLSMKNVIDQFREQAQNIE